MLPNFHEYGDFFASKVTEWNNYFRGLDPARYIPDLMGHYIVTGAWKVVVAAYALSWFDVGRDILRISRNVVLLAFLTTLICLPFIVWKPLLILYVVAIYFREGLFPWVTSTTVGLQIKKGHTFRDALFFHIGPMVLWYAPVLAIAIFATVFGVTGIWASFWLLAGTSVYILGLSKITKSIYRQSKERFVLFKIGIVLALLGMTVVTGLLLAYAILPFLGLSSPWFFEALLGQNVIPAVLEKSIFFKGITIVAALFVGLPTAFLLTETGMSKKLRYPRHISAERELSNRINPPRMGPLLAEKESVDMEMRLLGALGGAPAEQVERLRETQRVLTQRLRSAGATEDGGGNFSPPVFDRDAVVEQILGSEENKGGIAKKYALEDREKTLLYLEALTLFLPEKERIAYDDPLSKLLQKIANRQMHRIWPNITLPFLGHIGDWEGDTFDKKQKVEVLRKYLFSKKSRRFLRNAERRRIVRLYGPVVEKEFFSGAAGGGALRPIRRRPPQAPRPTRSPAQAHSLGSQVTEPAQPAQVERLLDAIDSMSGLRGQHALSQLESAMGGDSRAIVTGVENALGRMAKRLVTRGTNEQEAILLIDYASGAVTPEMLDSEDFWNGFLNRRLAVVIANAPADTMMRGDRVKLDSRALDVVAGALRQAQPTVGMTVITHEPILRNVYQLNVSPELLRRHDWAREVALLLGKQIAQFGEPMVRELSRGGMERERNVLYLDDDSLEAFFTKVAAAELAGRATRASA